MTAYVHAGNSLVVQNKRKLKVQDESFFNDPFTPKHWYL